MTTPEPDAPAPPADRAAEKAELRRAVVAARAALPAVQRQACSAAIVQRLLALPALHGASTVAAYLGLEEEIATDAFVEQLIAEGRRVLLPRVVDVQSRERRHLVLHRVEDIARDTLPGRWGIREPDAQCCPAVAPAEVDLVLLPGVAFDRHGGRLGYGAGFYDRLLAGVSSRCIRVAAAFSLQVVPRVPIEPHDQRYQWLVTEQETTPAALDWE